MMMTAMIENGDTDGGHVLSIDWRAATFKRKNGTMKSTEILTERR